MNLIPGDTVLWVHDGMSEEVVFMGGPDKDGFYLIKRTGQPAFPVPLDQLCEKKS
jgi:hypothetical protein